MRRRRPAGAPLAIKFQHGPFARSAANGGDIRCGLALKYTFQLGSSSETVVEHTDDCSSHMRYVNRGVENRDVDDNEQRVGEINVDGELYSVVRRSVVAMNTDV